MRDKEGEAETERERVRKGCEMEFLFRNLIAQKLTPSRTAHRLEEEEIFIHNSFFFTVKCSPHLFLNPLHFRLHISSHWSSFEGSAGKPWGGSWDPGKAELKQFEAGCQELVISVATGIRTGWGWEHLKLCIRGSDTVSNLYLSHRDQLTCYVHRIDFLDSKTKLGPSSMFSWSASLTLL